MRFENTICAPATSVGSGAISLIRVSGPDALHIADKVIAFRSGSASQAQGYSIKYGTIKDVDDVLVSIFHAPHSYTGEDSVEISCHASTYIVSRIIELLCSNGARPAEAGEFTRRAFINGKMDLTQAEAVADVIQAENEAAHRIASTQLKGGFSKELKQMREDLLDITSLMELELDFSEEDVEFADRTRLLNLVKAVISKCNTLANSFRIGNAIKNGVPVTIAGTTNTGKSTLLNALLGEDRAIVSDIAGTTRDTVEDTVVIGGTLFRFIDTAGIRETNETIEKIGINRSLDMISKADIVLGVLDSTKPLEAMLQDAEFILNKVSFEQQYLILLLNKSDLKCTNNNVTFSNKIVQLSEKYKDKLSILSISALTGSGFTELKATLQEIQRKRVSLSMTSESTTLITNLRHKEALEATSTCLEKVLSGLQTALPTDLLTQDLREAIQNLGTITGEISTDEVLGRIFERFCIGK